MTNLSTWNPRSYIVNTSKTFWGRGLNDRTMDDQKSVPRTRDRASASLAVFRSPSSTSLESSYVVQRDALARSLDSSLFIRLRLFSYVCVCVCVFTGSIALSAWSNNPFLFWAIHYEEWGRSPRNAIFRPIDKLVDCERVEKKNETTSTKKKREENI